VTGWLTLKEGLKAPGLRIAPVREVPSPWSELCRALFRVKQIPFTLVSARDPQLGLADLKAATGQDALPAVFFESERPRSNWLEQLSLAESRRRCEHIVSVFAGLVAAERGFLAGNTLSALDIGWASFAALIQPLPNDLCPMDPLWRDIYTWTPAEIAPANITELLAHRGRIYRDWIELPTSA
jgi:hypothetical protein